jgi:hypothetical protein
LARRRLNTIYRTIPKSCEWLIINFEIIVVVGVLPRFNILRGDKLQDDYIKLFKLAIYIANQKKVRMIYFLFKGFIPFFKKSILGGVSFTNRHLLVLNGHDNHVTIPHITWSTTIRCFLVLSHLKQHLERSRM